MHEADSFQNLPHYLPVERHTKVAVIDSNQTAKAVCRVALCFHFYAEFQFPSNMNSN